MKKFTVLFSVVAVMALALTGCTSQKTTGGSVHNTRETFDAGIAVNGTEIINSSGQYVGAFNGTTITASGATTLSGTNVLSGATTLSGTTKVQATASSTIIVGGAGTGGGYTAGCIKIGDSGNATATPVYITATGSTITATTTRPTACSSQ